MLRLVSVMNLIFTLFCPFSMQEKEPYLYDFSTLAFACIQIFTVQFLKLTDLV